VGEDSLPVGFDRTAGVELGVDERPQLCGCFDRRVQVQAELSEHPEFRAEPGGRYQHIDAHLSLPVRGHSVNGQRAFAGEVGDGEGGEDLDASGVDQLAQSRAECSPRCELVLFTAPVHAGEVSGANGLGVAGHDVVDAGRG
jgi:hypothetical protein